MRPPRHFPALARRALPCLFLCVLATAPTGCTAPSARPDADVERAVQREERREAGLVVVAELDEAPLEMAAAGGDAGPVALAAVRPAAPADSPAAGSVPPGAVAGWHYRLPAAWAGPRPILVAPRWDDLLGPGPTESTVAGFELVTGDDGDGAGERANPGRPHLRFDFLRLRFYDRPVVISGSAKGGRGLQVRAVVKL